MLMIPFLVIVGGCSSGPQIKDPTVGMHAISPASTDHNGSMQHALDRWLQNEWIPLTSETNTTVRTQEHFTFQYYVDKWKRYNAKRSAMDANQSHIDRIQNLPVIGVH